MLARAVAPPSERCHRVLTLRKLCGLPQKEIAARLEPSENTVERLGGSYLKAWRDEAGRSQFERRRSASPRHEAPYLRLATVWNRLDQTTLGESGRGMSPRSPVTPRLTRG